LIYSLFDSVIMAEKISEPLVSSTGAPKTPGMTSVASLFTWFGTKGDYSKLAERDKALTGWRRHFSTYTLEGRWKITVATYIATAMIGVYVWRRMKASKQKQASVE